MSKLVKYFLIIITFTTICAGEWFENLNIVSVDLRSNGHCFVELLWTGNYHKFANANTAEGRAMIAVLLQAHASGKTISLEYPPTYMINQPEYGTYASGIRIH